MNDVPDRALESGPQDAGCEAYFEMLEEYAEAQVEGVDADRVFPAFAVHLAQCAGCREHCEELVAALRDLAPPDDLR